MTLGILQNLGRALSHQIPLPWVFACRMVWRDHSSVPQCFNAGAESDMGGSFAGTSDSPALKAVVRGPDAGNMSQPWYMSPSAQSDICLKPGLQRHPSGVAVCRQQHPQLDKPQWANAPGCSIWDVLLLSPAVLLVWPWPGWSHCWLSWAQPCPDRISVTGGHTLCRKCGWRAGPDLSLAWSDSPVPVPAQPSKPSHAPPAAFRAGFWMQPVGFGLVLWLGEKSPLSCVGSSQSCAKPAL